MANFRASPVHRLLDALNLILVTVSLLLGVGMLWWAWTMLSDVVTRWLS